MTETVTTRQRSSWRRWVRIALGTVVGLAVLVAATVFVLAQWNPWQLVALRLHFHDVFLGMVIVGVGGYLAAWLLWPVRNEAVQRARLTTRLVIVGIGLVGLLGWALFGHGYETEVMAVSPDGEWELVWLGAQSRDGDVDSKKDVFIWTGDGLGTREVGHLGKACGSLTGSFLDDRTVEVSSAYGTWEIGLTEDGSPTQVLGPHCTDGPVPATLGG